MILTDDELRNAAIEIMRLPTGRTLQERIGASDLAVGCDRCLAMRMRGHDRPSPQADRPWMGKEWGTAGHLLMQSRIDSLMQESEGLTEIEREQMRRLVGLPLGTRTEVRLMVADLRGYGPGYGHIDLWLPGQIGDWKGSTRIKSALLQHFLAQLRGETSRWEKQKDTARYEGGWKLKLDSHTVVSFSAREFADAMDVMVYKMNGYFAQQTMYMHGRTLAGSPVTRGSIIWLNRDGNGFFDDPASARYEDPKAHHDVWVMSFDYHPEEAQRLIARAERIWAQLEAGAAFADFEQSERCWPCSMEEKQESIPDVDGVMGVRA